MSRQEPHLMLLLGYFGSSPGEASLGQEVEGLEKLPLVDALHLSLVLSYGWGLVSGVVRKGRTDRPN